MTSINGCRYEAYVDITHTIEHLDIICKRKKKPGDIFVKMLCKKKKVCAETVCNTTPTVRMEYTSESGILGYIIKYKMESVQKASIGNYSSVTEDMGCDSDFVQRKAVVRRFYIHFFLINYCSVQRSRRLLIPFYIGLKNGGYTDNCLSLHI